MILLRSCHDWLACLIEHFTDWLTFLTDRPVMSCVRQCISVSETHYQRFPTWLVSLTWHSGLRATSQHHINTTLQHYNITTLQHYNFTKVLSWGSDQPSIYQCDAHQIVGYLIKYFQTISKARYELHVSSVNYKCHLYVDINYSYLKE